MTRYFFIGFFFLSTLLVSLNKVYAKGHKQTKMTVIMMDKDDHTDIIKTEPPLAELPKNASKNLPADDSSEKKAHPAKTEELPHIHHFHKERVKKAKHHHKKFWILSKLLLILCHMTLLILASMHAVQ